MKQYLVENGLPAGHIGFEDGQYIFAERHEDSIGLVWSSLVGVGKLLGETQRLLGTPSQEQTGTLRLKEHEVKRHTAEVVGRLAAKSLEDVAMLSIDYPGCSVTWRAPAVRQKASEAVLGEIALVGNPDAVGRLGKEFLEATATTDIAAKAVEVVRDLTTAINDPALLAE